MIVKTKHVEPLHSLELLVSVAEKWREYDRKMLLLGPSDGVRFTKALLMFLPFGGLSISFLI